MVAIRALESCIGWMVRILLGLGSSCYRALEHEYQEWHIGRLNSILWIR